MLIFPEGSGPGTILRDNVTIVDDEISEMTEDFLLSAFITNPSNPASFVDGRDTATGLIIDNDCMLWHAVITYNIGKMDMNG